MPGRVEGKVAFITGAARGQGRSHAVRLAEEGADVIAIDICEQVKSANYQLATPEDLEETVRLVEQQDRRIVAAQADVRDRAGMKSFLDGAVAELGHLEVVVSAAGIATYAAVDQITEGAWQEMLDINLTGVWNTCVVAMPHLIESGGGSIVITSSGAAVRAPENLAHYTASKQGAIGLMRTMAKELAKHNIRANAIYPTQVDTPMIMHEEIYRMFRPDLENPGKEDIVEISERMNMLSVPWVESIDISNGVLFLVSDEARYVTGSEMRIDAGYGAM
jgi:(+)-trans-carveol dehydrogenase